MNEKNKGFTKDLLQVIFSNCIVLIGSILAGFVIPKLLGVTEYGYYKIFSLYLGYIGLLHFGFVDGILLKFAGKEYDNLDKKKFRGYTSFFITFQGIISLIIVLISVLFLPTQFKYMFILLGIDTLALNLTSYYQYVSQSTMRFKELSLRKILLAMSKIVLIFVLLWVKHILKITPNANFYVTGLVLIDALLVIWYMSTYRDITFGEKNSHNSEDLSDIKQFFKDGIILTVAFQAAHLVFSLDRQFVSILFDTRIYGVYSFAYNLISMVTTVVGAVSLVLFPRLKQMDKNELMKTYPISLAGISIVAFAAMVGFQPLCWFINWYLPDYSSSAEYLKIIFPGLALSCSISIIMFTYYKALNAHLIYFRNCCIVLVIGILSNTIAYFGWKSPSSISVASIFTLITWYLINERYFVKRFRINWKYNFSYAILTMLSFYLVNTILKNQLIAWFSYSCAFILLTVFFYKSEMLNIISKVFHKNLSLSCK